MTNYHIFYDSSKEVVWATTADMNSDIITAEESKGLTYVLLECTETPVPEKFYINDAGDQVATKSVFSPSFSTTSPAVDDVVNVTGVPSGAEVFLDGVSAGTMSDTTLTLTAQESGEYKIGLKKSQYQDYEITYTVKRHGE